MGKIIEEYIEAKQHQAYVTRTIEKLWDIAQKYKKLEADYNKRLKTEKMVMLTELKFEIEELDTPNNGSAYMDCVEIIQQKINALRGEVEDGNNT